MMEQSGKNACNKEGSTMVVRLYAVACLAFGCLLLGGSGIALAGDDSYGGGQSGGYSTPDAAAHPDAPGDEAAPAQPDDAGPGPDDHGGDDAPPPQPEQPE
jgi:hypothetical protein